MHFGKIVKGVAYGQGYSAGELAELLERTERDVLDLYEQADWTSGNIRAVSVALGYNFGKYFDGLEHFNFSNSGNDESNEIIISIRYTRGKEHLLKFWLGKMRLVARAIGLELNR